MALGIQRSFINKMETKCLDQEYVDAYFAERGWKRLEQFQSVKIPVLAMDPDGIKCLVRFFGYNRGVVASSVGIGHPGGGFDCKKPGLLPDRMG